MKLIVNSRSGDERFFGGPRFGRSGSGNLVPGNNESKFLFFNHILYLLLYLILTFLSTIM